jgi:hypothetical protein
MSGVTVGREPAYKTPDEVLNAARSCIKTFEAAGCHLWRHVTYWALTVPLAAGRGGGRQGVTSGFKPTFKHLGESADTYDVV